MIEIHHVQSLPYLESDRRDSLLAADHDLKDDQSKEIWRQHHIMSLEAKGDLSSYKNYEL